MRQAFSASLRHQHRVGDAGAEALLGDEHRWADRQGHAGEQGPVITVFEMESLSGGRRKARRDPIAGGVRTMWLEPGLTDDAPGSLVRPACRNSGRDGRDAGLIGRPRDLIELTQPRARLAEAEAAPDGDRVAPIGCAIFDIARVAVCETALGGAAMAERCSLSRDEVERAC